MKFYLISDNSDTLVGMRLAGIKGQIVKEREEAVKLLEDIAASEDVGIILITERLADKIRDEIGSMKIKLSRPLIVEIPDRHGSIKDDNYIMNYVRESIGIRI